MNNPNELTGDDLLTLLFLPMTDDRILNVITAFGWELPAIDERYEEERKVAIHDDDKSGLAFVFRELDGFDQTGDLRLAEIDFSHDRIVPAPFGLKFQDNYKTCCQKLDSNANYQHKRVKELKMWVREYNNLNLSISIFFSEGLTCIRSIVLAKFNEKRVGKQLIEANQ